MSRSSAGGAAAAGGENHQGRVLAWLSVYMLGEAPLPMWAGGQVPEAVGGQTSHAVDDIAAILRDGGLFLVQAKKGMNLGRIDGSPLAKALEQLVAVDRDGVLVRLPDEDRDVRRQLEPERDRVAILTDESAPATVRDHLRTVCERLRQLDARAPLDGTAHPKPEWEALKVLLGHLRRLAVHQDGSQPSEADIRRITRVLEVRGLALGDGGPDRQTALEILKGILPAPERAGTVWTILVARMQEVAEQRIWLRRDNLVRELERDHGVILRPLFRLRADIQRLRERTTVAFDRHKQGPAVLTVPDAPGGFVSVRRQADAVVAGTQGNLAVIGEPGAGKTVVLYHLAKTLRQAGSDVVVLDADDLTGSAGQTRIELGLQHDLTEVVLGWSDNPPGVLVIDGLDQTRGADTSRWLPELARRLAGSRWRLVATVRRYDLLHGPAWQQMFAGAPPTAAHSDGAMSSVSHVLVDDLNAAEIQQVREASPLLASLLDEADDQLRRLLANPFNLQLAASLLATNTLPPLHTIRRRLNLLDAYWRTRVAEPADHHQRTVVLTSLVEQMLRTRRPQVNRPAQVVETAALPALNGLLHDGVLREQPQPRASGDAAVKFAHPVLFDYATAVLTFDDPDNAQNLADRLDQDQDLAIVARPSMDYHFAAVWEAHPNRQPFWELALRLHAANGGHVLASAAAAAVASREATTTDDLDPLLAACITGPSSSGITWTRDDARALTYLVIAMMATRWPTAPQPIHDIRWAVDAAERLAVAAQEADDVNLAQLAMVMLHRLDRVAHLVADTPMAVAWARTAGAGLAVALAAPEAPGRQPLAVNAVVAAGPVLGQAPDILLPIIRRTIAEEVMAEWGASVLVRLLDHLAELAAVDSEAAIELACAAWEFEETSSASTSIGHSVLMPLRWKRQADAEQARFTVGQKFPAILRSSPLVAVQLLLRLVEADHMLLEDDGPPVSTYSVRSGRSLESAGGHGTLAEMIHLLGRSLNHLAASATSSTSDQSSPVLTQVTALLANRLTNGAVWTHLLDDATRTGGIELCRLLLPALTEGDLLAHWQTHDAAARLAAQVSPHVTNDEHRALETAIWRVTSAADTTTGEPHEVAAARRAQLLNALDRDRILNPDVVRWLADYENTGHTIAPVPQPPVQGGGFAVSTTFLPLAHPHGSDFETDALQPLISVVEQAVQQARSSSDADRTAGLSPLADSLTTLHAAIESRTDLDQVTTDAACRQEVFAAQLLTQHDAVKPGTVLGDLVLNTLRAALPTVASPAPPPGTPNVGGAVNTDSVPLAWGETPARSAAQGLCTLFARPDWAAVHGDLATILAPHLDDPDPACRDLVTYLLPRLMTTNAEVLGEVEQRLSTEEVAGVQDTLIATLFTVAAQAPHEVDTLLCRLARQSRWAIIGTDPGNDGPFPAQHPTGALVTLVCQLGIGSGTPVAWQTLRTWFGDPCHHPHRVTHAVTAARPVLNPPPTTAPDGQRRAFDLLALCPPILAAAWHEATSGAPGQDQQQLATVITVASRIAEQLRFASGQANQHTTPNTVPGDPGQYADHALPLLERLAAITHPTVTHPIVQTVAHLMEPSGDPARCYRIAAGAIRPNSGYENEQQAATAVMNLVDRFLADHHDLLVNDRECLSATRTLLGAFVRAGWEDAIRRVERLDIAFE